MSHRQPTNPPSFALFQINFPCYSPFSAAEVQQTDNNKRRKKDATPNLEDFLPSEKRAKYTKKCGNEIPGQRLQFGDKNGKGNAQEVNLEEEDPDSDLEILREEAAHEAERLQKEQQRQDLLDAKKCDKAYRTAALKEAGAGDQDTWKDRQLVARSRAWLTKKSDKDVEDDDDDIEVALGDSSDDDSPAKYNNRQNQEEKPSTTPSGINNDTKSPNFTAPKALENALMIVVQDKFGHIIQCRVKRTGNLGKLIKGFTKQAVENARKVCC